MTMLLLINNKVVIEDRTVNWFLRSSINAKCIGIRKVTSI